MDHSAVNSELTLFSYEILGLVGRGGAGPHDLLRMARHGRILAWAGESQYYVEPKRLARLGYLAAHKEPGKTRERTVYTLTEKGLDALRAWAQTPVRFTPVKSELLLRLLIADLVGEAATRQGIDALRDDIADLFDRLRDSEARAATFPHRRKYLVLANRFLRRLLDLHLDFVAQIERELAPNARKRSLREANAQRRPTPERDGAASMLRRPLDP
jgi:DNA-binding PadR family transcriptional regulator